MNRITVVDESNIRLTVSDGASAVLGHLSGKLDINLVNVANLTNAQAAAFRLAIFAETKGELPDSGEITGDHIADGTITINNLDPDVLIGKLDTDLANALDGAWAAQKTVILRELSVYDTSQVDGLLEDKLDTNFGNPSASDDEIIEFRNYIEAGSIADITEINTTITALALTVHNTETGIRALITFETADRKTAVAGLQTQIDNIDTGINYRVVVNRTPLLLAEELQHPHYSNSQVIEFTAPTAAKAGFYADTFNNDGAIITGGGGIDRAGIILRAVQDGQKITVHLDRPIDLGDEAFFYNETEIKQVSGARGGAIADDGVWVVAGRGDVSDLKNELDVTIEAVVALANSHIVLHDVVIGDSILLGRAWTHPAINNNVITFTFDNPDSALAVAGILSGGAIGPVDGDENDARIVVSVAATDDIRKIKVYLDGPLIVAASTSESSLIQFWRASSSGAVTRLIGFDYDADTQSAIGVGPSTLNAAIAGVMSDTDTLLEAFRDVTIETNRVVSGNVAKIDLNVLAIQNKLGSDLSNYKGTRVQGEAFLADKLYGITTEQVSTAISLVADGKLGTDLTGLDTTNSAPIIAFKADTGIDADIEIAKSFYVEDGNTIQRVNVSDSAFQNDKGSKVISFGSQNILSDYEKLIVGYITYNNGAPNQVVSHNTTMTVANITYERAVNLADVNLLKAFTITELKRTCPITFITGVGVDYNADMGVLKLPNPEKSKVFYAPSSSLIELLAATFSIRFSGNGQLALSPVTPNILEDLLIDIRDGYVTSNGGSQLRPADPPVIAGGEVIAQYNHIGGFQSGDDVKVFAFTRPQKDNQIEFIILDDGYDSDSNVLDLQGLLDNKQGVLAYNNAIFDETQGTAAALFAPALNTVYLYSNRIFTLGKATEHVLLPANPKIGDKIEFYLIGKTFTNADFLVDLTAPSGIKINGGTGIYSIVPTVGGHYRFTWTGQSNIGWLAVLTSGRQ